MGMREWWLYVWTSILIRSNWNSTHELPLLNCQGLKRCWIIWIEANSDWTQKSKSKWMMCYVSFFVCDTLDRDLIHILIKLVTMTKSFAAGTRFLCMLGLAVAILACMGTGVNALTCTTDASSTTQGGTNLMVNYVRQFRRPRSTVLQPLCK